jgi:hypothetical protein
MIFVARASLPRLGLRQPRDESRARIPRHDETFEFVLGAVWLVGVGLDSRPAGFGIGGRTFRSDVQAREWDGVQALRKILVMDLSEGK